MLIHCVAQAPAQARREAQADTCKQHRCNLPELSGRLHHHKQVFDADAKRIVLQGRDKGQSAGGVCMGPAQG